MHCVEKHHVHLTCMSKTRQIQGCLSGDMPAPLTLLIVFFSKFTAFLWPLASTSLLLAEDQCLQSVSIYLST